MRGDGVAGVASQLVDPAWDFLMPTNLSEFEDDTAFERYVLDRATPLLPRVAGTSVIELGDANSTSVAVGVQPVTVHVGVVDSTGSGGDQLSPDDIRPLLFGAAWKILDQLVELGLGLANVAHDRRWDYSISLKVGAATRGTVPAVPPFDGRSDLWTRVMHSYPATEAVRHSLVDRRLTVDRSTGELAGVARPGESAPTFLSVDEQSAFCQVAVGAAEAAISGELPTRRAGRPTQLVPGSNHRTARSASVRNLTRTWCDPGSPVRPSTGPSNDLTLDFSHISARARQAVGGVSHYDLEIHLPDGRILAGPLEDALNGPATFSIDDPPTWLRWA
jgi:hypothetical protein